MRAHHPDFLVIGAPKAGTTALHAALARHPEVFNSTPKEPKYFLCDDAPPPHWGGPGDRHSQQEWIWRREQYDALFAPARTDQVRGESTPFYLWSKGAHRRIAEALPEVKLLAVVRDPVDRAHSNWMHLWSDGLEPEADFVTAFGMERARVRAGWAPFWRYGELGRYGEQLAHLFDHVDRDRVLVMRYRDLVDTPVAAVDRACRFLGIGEGQVDQIPRDNARAYAEPGWRTRLLGPVVRGAATAAQFAPPQLWRRASRPLVSGLSAGGARRPRLSPEERGPLVEHFAEDVATLSALTGEDFSDWLSTQSRGAFDERAAGATPQVSQPPATPAAQGAPETEEQMVSAPR